MPTLIPQCEKDEYLVKTIEWRNKKVRIITQNENGPCPLVAICNVLFLRGDLDIQPPDRELVTFEYLVDRLGDYLLTRAPGANEANIATTSKLKHLDSALIILPDLKSGLDVNVIFDSIRGFELTAELSMFDIFNIDLVHGWIVDPQDKETYETIQKHGATYNKAVEFIVQLDDDTIQPKSNTDQGDEGLMLTTTEEEKLLEGFIIKEFLKDTATQLTYYGLELLLNSIPKDSLCVLFRNNHFSTLYRHPDLGLYMLVTDSGLALESSVIWESLSDIDQGSSEFLDGFFNRPVTTLTSDTQQYDLMEGQDSLNTDLE
ncbi:MAG: hypothetical protein EXX96DRAFT_479020 [Benjaminiella poitrasii]|nr:MAG: hypothetical protein EXX96DRAFT_479020 [Benjaminiella poitrasii]